MDAHVGEACEPAISSFGELGSRPFIVRMTNTVLLDAPRDPFGKVWLT
jgi:hypothetical protein